MAGQRDAAPHATRLCAALGPRLRARAGAGQVTPTGTGHSSCLGFADCLSQRPMRLLWLRNDAAHVDEKGDSSRRVRAFEKSWVTGKAQRGSAGSG